MANISIPKGTRDFGPSIMGKRQFILNNIKSVYQQYGFLPLETPAMENLSVLTGKYGEEGDQLLFKILNTGDFLKDADAELLNEKASKKVTQQIAEKGLRYDLTVPFARYVVMNRHEITLPFKRYQIQPVWRADRPQKGRYREFYQCDADVVGTTSLLCEAEIICMIKAVMHQLSITDYTIKINHRGVLAGLADIADAKGKEVALYTAIDKLDKIGEEKVKEELISVGFTAEQSTNIFNLLNYKGTNQEKFQYLKQTFEHSTSGTKGINDLLQVFSILDSLQESDAQVEFDVALARGLSYYTGCIFEVKINNVKIGSISGGGRYDNLTQSFDSKENLSGVGISFGVDRIFDVMEELNLFPKETTQSSKVLVAFLDEESMQFAYGVVASIRKQGIAAELYPDFAKIKKQLDYANKKQIPYAIIIGEEERKQNKLALKNLESGEQSILDMEALIHELKHS
ncbi:MAG: histidine--tRNA ligase [Cyclobacteriaceae bacterium]|jgi:histidyl-tRNA synthetase|nr:histidine--tRNA ligase [Cyclobacteriaceae bacterium]